MGSVEVDAGKYLEHEALCSAGDVAIVIPSKTTARIQEMHILLGHTLCALLEREQFAAD